MLQNLTLSLKDMYAFATAPVDMRKGWLKAALYQVRSPPYARPPGVHPPTVYLPRLSSVVYSMHEFTALVKCWTSEVSVRFCTGLYQNQGRLNSWSSLKIYTNQWTCIFGCRKYNLGSPPPPQLDFLFKNSPISRMKYRHTFVEVDKARQLQEEISAIIAQSITTKFRPARPKVIIRRPLVVRPMREPTVTKRVPLVTKRVPVINRLEASVSVCCVFHV